MTECTPVLLVCNFVYLLTSFNFLQSIYTTKTCIVCIPDFVHMCPKQ